MGDVVVSVSVGICVAVNKVGHSTGLFLLLVIVLRVIVLREEGLLLLDGQERGILALFFG